MKVAHWPLACGCEATAAMRSSGTGGARDQAVVDRVHELAGDLDAAVALRERVERRVDRALERVLDRHERALDAALAHRRDGVVDGRERHRLEVRAPPPASTASSL